MKTKNIKNIFAGIFALTFLVLALAPMVSAGQTWFYFQSNTGSSTLTVNQGAQVPLIMTASSNNYVPVSNEKLEAVSVGTLALWNTPGTQYGSTYLWTNTYNLDTNSLGVGTFTLKFSSQTNTGLQSSTLTLIVIGPNNPPQITSTPITTVNEGTVYSYQVTATDADLDPLTYSLSGNASWLSIDSNTGLVNGTAPLVTSNTDYNVTVTVSDGQASDVQSYTLTVIDNPTNDIISPNVTISSPQNITYTVPVTSISYNATDNVALSQCWYSLDLGITNSTSTTCTGSFTGLVPKQGSNTWTVYANDTSGNIGSANVTFTVNDTISPVITAVSPINGEELDDTEVTLKVSTNEDAVVKYSINGAANVTMTKTSNFAFQSALLALNDNEEYTVVYTATDIMGNVASLTIKFDIDEDADDNEENVEDDTSFGTDDLDGVTIEPEIDLTDEDASGLNWWQRFVNWLCRLLGLEEVY